MNLNSIRNGFFTWIDRHQQNGDIQKEKADKLKAKFSEIFAHNPLKHFDKYAKKLNEWTPSEFNRHLSKKISEALQKALHNAAPAPAPAPAPDLRAQQLEDLERFKRATKTATDNVLHELNSFMRDFYIKWISAKRFDSYSSGDTKRREALDLFRQTLASTMTRYSLVHDKSIEDLKRAYPHLDQSVLDKTIEKLHQESESVQRSLQRIEIMIEEFRCSLLEEKRRTPPPEFQPPQAAPTPFDQILGHYDLPTIERAITPESSNLRAVLEKIRQAQRENNPYRIFDLDAKPLDRAVFERNCRKLLAICHPDKNPQDRREATMLFQLCNAVKDLIIKNW